jgi:hypothetical protein
MMTYDLIPSLIAQIQEENIKHSIDFLAGDPLRYRKVNYTRPGQTKNSLEEADDFISACLESSGYTVARHGVQVRPLRPDPDRPGTSAFIEPAPDDPWYIANNLFASTPGTTHPNEIILLVAHKDSQSWIDSPGAYDNAVGVAANLEIARVLAKHVPQRTVRFLFCNEEHRPWTSITAAEQAHLRGDAIVGVFNLDGLAGKSRAETDAGLKTNITLYSAPEGKRLAELVARMNGEYAIGLEQSIQERPFPNDDDGSFVRAGYPAAIITIGSFPYADPNYHMPGDIPELVDVENVAMTARAVLAAVVSLDRGDPS